MTDADFGMDTALREMLHERAQDITSVPARLVDLDVPHEPTRTRPKYWLIAAAVLAVLAIAAGVTAVARRHTSSAPAKPVPVRVTTLKGCTTALPHAWIQVTTHPTGPAGWTVLDVAANGTALVGRVNPTKVELDTLTSRRAVPLAIPAGLQLGTSAVTGNYAVIGLTRDGFQLERVDVIDMATLRTVRSVRVGSAKGLVSESMTVSDGRVYWDVRANARPKTSVIHSFDIATGRRGVVYSGRYAAPLASAAGVYRRDAKGHLRIIHVGNNLPPAVRDATTPISGATMATDGTHYVWNDAAHHRIGWSDGTDIRYLPTKWLTVADHDPTGGVGVAGPFAFAVDNSRSYGDVIDMRTGAVADLSGPGVTHGGTIDTLHPGPVLALGGGTVAVGGVGLPLGDPQGSIHILQFDTAPLPGLHC